MKAIVHIIVPSAAIGCNNKRRVLLTADSSHGPEKAAWAGNLPILHAEGASQVGVKNECELWPTQSPVIADAYFDDAKFDEALSYYRDFSELHPDHEKVPYTILRAAHAYYHQSRPANRDQTATRQAIAQLERLRDDYPQAAESAEADQLWRELRTRLGTSVMNIGNFYMERSEYRSAADRFRSVLNEYPGLGLDAEALFKLGLCYREMNLGDEAARIFQVILENYQGSEIAAAAQDFVPASN